LDPGKTSQGLGASRVDRQGGTKEFLGNIGVIVFQEKIAEFQAAIQVFWESRQIAIKHGLHFHWAANLP
jgi:hypothetical protein